MTSEPRSATEPWITAKKVRHPYAYDPKGSLARFFGVRGIPRAVLIDPTGKIVWSGHPGGLSDSIVQKSLAGALTKPLWEWKSSAKGVKAAFQKRQYAAALEAASSLSEADEGPQILEAIRSHVTARVTALKESYGQGDFLTVAESGAELEKGLAGLPEAADVASTLAQLEDNEAAPKVMAAQKQIKRMREACPHKKREIEAALKDLERIKDALPGTYAAKEAAAFIQELEEGRSK